MDIREFNNNIDQIMREFLNKSGWKGLSPENVIKEFTRFSKEWLEKKDDTFCSVRWSMEDIEGLLKGYGIPVIDENIKKVMEKHEEIKERFVADGWITLDVVIDDLNRNGEFKNN